MPKYLLIQTCRECGFVEEKPDYSLKWGKRYYCEKLNREVDPDRIDPDCGLPDYEEAGAGMHNLEELIRALETARSLAVKGGCVILDSETVDKIITTLKQEAL